jgi:hypothetical protein
LQGHVLSGQRFELLLRGGLGEFFSFLARRRLRLRFLQSELLFEPDRQRFGCLR